VKQYAELAPTIRDAVAQYAAEVRDGAFPEPKHTYGMADEELALFEDALAEVRTG
jgi:3-methyl-2-oxobutanoate hydroxymethyltransferase